MHKLIPSRAFMLSVSHKVVYHQFLTMLYLSTISHKYDILSSFTVWYIIIFSQNDITSSSYNVVSSVSHNFVSRQFLTI